MSNSMEFPLLHINASESMRKVTDPSLSRQERISQIEITMDWTRKMFIAANENVYERMLALGMYQTVSGMQMFAIVDYDSVVVTKSTN